jgi:hypothetical protein
VLADEPPVAIIVGMHGDGGVAEHGLGSRGGDHDVGRCVVRVEGAIFQRIAQMPEVALHLDLLDFEVRDGGEQLRVPIDQALVFVDEAGAVEIDEHLAHRARKPLVHGEALARPIARRAESLQLIDDQTARLDLPLPDAAHELVAAERAAVRLLALHQLALDHHLGGDAGMVGARLPQHVAAAHALEADEDVLQRIVERVTHMQRAGHVRRRDDDGEGPRAGAVRTAGGKRLRLFPQAVDRALDGGWLVGLVEHRRFGSDEEAGLASYDFSFCAVNNGLQMLRRAQRARLET